ncbi:MAG: hypothetical protein K2X35_02975 [Bryobacteraceae bacterium]|nr:hypothetical protein [Bryobacteraceae bacterium]
MAVEKAPVNPPSFPPAGFAGKHRVSTGDNWKSLADKYCRSDVWDIIYFNFRTMDPKEVNWLLRKMIGCTTQTPDGNNYRFSSSDSPGIVYIPPASWTKGSKIRTPVPGESDSARSAVLWALAKPHLQKINFSYGGHRFDVSSYLKVANAIIDRRIGVAIDGALGSQCVYDSGTNTIYVPSNGVSLSRQAAIIHEATHAYLDIQKSGVTKFKSETAAYLAQAIFALEIFADGNQLVSENPYTMQVFKIAWMMAEELGKGKSLGSLSLELSALEAAVQNHPEYKKDAFKTAGFDGL